MYPRIYSPRSKYKDLPNLSKIIKNYSFRLASLLEYYDGNNYWIMGPGLPALHERP